MLHCVKPHSNDIEFRVLTRRRTLKANYASVIMIIRSALGDGRDAYTYRHKKKKTFKRLFFSVLSSFPLGLFL